MDDHSHIQTGTVGGQSGERRVESVRVIAEVALRVGELERGKLRRTNQRIQVMQHGHRLSQKAGSIRIGIDDQSSFCMSKIANVQCFAVGRHCSCLWIMQMQPFEETELDQPLVLIWQSAFVSFSELFDGKIDLANPLQKKVRAVFGLELEHQSSTIGDEQPELKECKCKNPVT
ncbi:hypothetical protein M5K25_021467 [Dendrobium thyrsiflorum]|uniref:Uncharacterized protein n=1 Tax=Dendrobium thyrsiflorum TaxID=117978 RepID=A0ABD0UCH1_DENTH